MTDMLPAALIRKGYLELVLRRLALLATMTVAEQDAIRGLAEPRRLVAKGHDLVADDQPRLYFVLDGWGCRVRYLNGRRRQIFDLILPGDIVGKLADETGQPRHSCIALTTVTLVDASSLAATDDAGAPMHPGILSAVTGFRIQAQERLLDHVVRLGGRQAYESVGHLLIELYMRQAEIGLASGFRLPFMVGQERLGEILGISEAHVNRTMTRLRADGHITIDRGWITLPKLKELARLVDYPIAES